ncbi:MAG: hypothetical protein AVDCRST_MAG23-372, partial [uncultured Sphingosinicella sp.]
DRASHPSPAAPPRASRGPPGASRGALEQASDDLLVRTAAREYRSDPRVAGGDDRLHARRERRLRRGLWRQDDRQDRRLSAARLRLHPLAGLLGLGPRLGSYDGLPRPCLHTAGRQPPDRGHRPPQPAVRPAGDALRLRRDRPGERDLEHTSACATASILRWI